MKRLKKLKLLLVAAAIMSGAMSSYAMSAGPDEMSVEDQLKAWREAASDLNAGGFPDRYKYIDAVTSVIEPGMTSDEVMALLGRTESVFENGIVYDAGSANFLEWPIEVLVIDVDADRRVTGHRVVSSEIYTSPGERLNTGN